MTKSQNSYWQTDKCSSKYMFLKILQYSQENMCWGLFLIKLQLWMAATLLKRDSAQVFSCEYYEIFTNIFFYKTCLVDASKKDDSGYF